MAELLVETYEETEQIPGDVAPEMQNTEAVAIIEKLGLKGQQQLMSPNTGDIPQNRIPYRLMRRDEWAVYSAICPDRTKLAAYEASPIPLRVLQVAAHAQETGFFKTIWVWSADKAAVKDPVLVGSTGESDWSINQSNTYILARWGKELRNLSELAKEATSSYITTWKNAIAEIKGDVSKFEAWLAEATPEAIIARASGRNETPTASGLNVSNGRW